MNAAKPESSCHSIACLALLIPIAWWATLSFARSSVVGDELFHQKVVSEILLGQQPSPGYLAMPPTFHWLAAWLTRPFQGSLWTVRGIVVAFSLLLLLSAYSVLRRLRVRPATSLFAVALNPLFLPYSALAYTDIPAAALVAASLAANCARVRWLGAAAAAASVLFRQSNVVWFAAVAFQPHDPRSSRLRRTLPYAVMVVAAAAGLWIMRDYVLATPESNRPRFNVAQVYCFLFCFGVIWLPLWIEEIARLWSSAIMPALMRGWGIAGFVGVAAAAALLFDNPHPWNADPDYLRNRMLVLIDNSGPVRAAICAFLVATAIAAFAYFRRQAEWRTLLAIWVLSAAYVLPHGMVDPRYYIVPLLALHLYMPLNSGQTIWLIAWNTILSVCVCTYIATADGPGGIL